MMEFEDMSLDDIINQAIKGSTSPGSCITSVSQQRSMISMGQRSVHTGAAMPKEPLPHDWHWVAGEPIKTRKTTGFFRGRGGWKARGNRHPFFNTRIGGRFGHQRFGHREFFSDDDPNRIPVHQRLGWLTPARRYALQRLRTARINLNQRQRAGLSARRQFQRQDLTDTRVKARFQQLREMRKMRGDDDDNASIITVSITNELAIARPKRGNWALRGGRGRGRGIGRPFTRPQFGARLSVQNVTEHAGLTGSPSGGSQSTFSKAGHSIYKRQRQALTRQLHMQTERQLHMQTERQLQAERQLPTTPHASSLQSVYRRLHSGNFTVPNAPHSVILDQGLQEEIGEIQRLAHEKPVYTKDAFEYRAPIMSTTTTMSARFGLVASCTSVA